jgi:general secretion pathway protein L
MSRKVLALDIQSNRVCAVLVKSSLRESRIAAFRAVTILPESEDGSGGLRAALETITATMDLNGTDCVVSLPAVLFSCRNLQVPFSSPKKIRMMLPFEIEPSLPFPAEQLAIDFSVVGTGTTPDQTEVLAAAIDKDRLTSVLEALSAVAIDPERVTLSGFSAALWIGRISETHGTTLCLDIGDTFGSLQIVGGSKVRLIRSFPLPAAAAGRARALQHHIRMTLSALNEAGESPDAPNEVVLTGSGVEGLDLEQLAADLPIALRTPSLKDEIDAIGVEDGAPGWTPARMDGALALALAEIEGFESLNFHRGQFPGKKIFSRYRENLIRTGTLAAAVLVLMFASVLVDAYIQQRRLDELNHRVEAIFKEAFPDAKKVADPYQQMKINLQDFKKSAALPGEALPTARSIDLLKNISDSIPEDVSVVFDRLVISPDTILISGTTGGFNAVDEIKGHLERIPAFKKVTISSANTDRSGKEVNFQLKLDMQP